MTSRDAPAQRSSRKRVLIGVALGMGIAVAIGGAFSAGLWTGNNSVSVAAPEVISSEPVTQMASAQRPTPSATVAPRRIPTCTVANYAADENLASFSGIVVDPVTGDVRFSRSADVALAPASVQKIITAGAALETLGPETTFSTTVLGTEDPEVVVLVGGGDATLSARAEDAASVYEGSPRIADLARLTIEALVDPSEEDSAVKISKVIVDAGLWDSEDSWVESWSRSATSNGFISHVTALQVDGDRQNPNDPLSRRSQDPVGKAASAFVAALRQAGNTARYVTISYEQAQSTGATLASVESRPVSELVTYMLKESDNTLAEMLARQVSLASGLGGTSASVGEALTSALAMYGLSPERVSLQDGSGLSPLNSVSPEYVADLLVEIYRSSTDLSLIAQALPVAGVDGSLDNRFFGDNAIAQSEVRAKTGSINGVRSLAGFITGADGADLVFAFFATGDVTDESRTALETLTTAVYSCGSNLADF